MSEVEPRTEIINQRPPFVIRGHHLTWFSSLVNRYSSNLLGEYVMRNIMETSLDVTRRDFISRDTTAKQEEEYAQDVLGIGLAQADKFRRHLVQTFENFLRLPDSHPAEIVEEVTDIICDGCAAGEHCRWKVGTETEDTMYMNVFLKFIALLDLPEPIITYEQALFLNAEPEQVRRVKTTLGTVKKVLKERPIF